MTEAVPKLNGVHGDSDDEVGPGGEDILRATVKVCLRKGRSLSLLVEYSTYK